MHGCDFSRKSRVVPSLWKQICRNAKSASSNGELIPFLNQYQGRQAGAVPETDPSIAEVNDFSGDNQRHAPAVRIGIFSLGCRQYILWSRPFLAQEPVQRIVSLPSWANIMCPLRSYFFEKAAISGQTTATHSPGASSSAQISATASVRPCTWTSTSLPTGWAPPDADP